MKCPCSAPDNQKNLRWALLILVIITLATWSIGLFHCSFILIEIDDIQVAFGPIRRATHHTEDQQDILGCRAYTSYEFDTFFDTAQSVGHYVGMIGFGIHAILLLLIFASIFFVQRMAKLLWSTSKVLVILSFACSIAMFSFGYVEECFQDESVQCVPGLSGMVALANAALMLVALVVSVLADPPSNPIFYLRLWNEKKDKNKSSKNSEKSTSSSNESSSESDVLLDSRVSSVLLELDSEREVEVAAPKAAYNVSSIESEDMYKSGEEKKFDPFQLKQKAKHSSEEEKREVESGDDYDEEVVFERYEEEDGKERKIQEYMAKDGSISIVQQAWQLAV